VSKQAVADLAIIISGNTAPVSASLTQVQRQFQQFAGQINNVTIKPPAVPAPKVEKAGEPASAVLAGIVGGAVVAAVELLASGLKRVAGLTYSVAEAAAKAAAEYESATTAYGVFVGDAGKGKALVDQIQQLAVATPFMTADLSKAGQMLLGMGVGAEDLLPALSRLGDLAAGDAVKLDRLSLAYGQVMAAGRFMGTELRQFTEAGVGVKDFAETAGMSLMKFRAEMEAGNVGADVVTKTINRLTNAGGRFYQMNAKASKTVRGQWSALTETVTIALQRVGTATFDKLDVAGRIGKLSDLLGGLSKQGPAVADALKGVGPVFDAALDAAKELAPVAKDLISILHDMVPPAEHVADAFRGAAIAAKDLAEVGGGMAVAGKDAGAAVAGHAVQTLPVERLVRFNVDAWDWLAGRGKKAFPLPSAGKRPSAPELAVLGKGETAEPGEVLSAPEFAVALKTGAVSARQMEQAASQVVGRFVSLDELAGKMSLSAEDFRGRIEAGRIGANDLADALGKVVGRELEAGELAARFRRESEEAAAKREKERRQKLMDEIGIDRWKAPPKVAAAVQEIKEHADPLE